MGCPGRDLLGLAVLIVGTAAPAHADWTVAAALVQDGRPVAAAIHAPVADDVADTADADPQIAVFPAFSLDHVLTLAQRDWLIARLDARSLPAGWVVDGLTVRQALRTIGRWIEANFEIDWIGRL